MNWASVEDQLSLLKRGISELIPEEELVEKLKKSAETDTPLKVKLGCDPTRPDLHLGHSVILRKLRQFQDLGHEAILIIGDFTALIGDPTGQNKTRPPLTEQEVKDNAKTYLEQVYQILDPSKTKLVYNSEWLGGLTFMDIIRESAKITVARMIERDDFSKRYQANEPISLHEFLYPLAQALDSVHLRSDVELGGTDQKFNLLMGRDMQRSEGQAPQVCLMMPLLVGTDGVQKMSKSYDNTIGLNDSAEDMYGKVLSISDEQIIPWAELLSEYSDDELKALQERVSSDPRNAKHDLAWHITGLFHGEEGAKKGRDHFETTVIQKSVPDDAPLHQMDAGAEEGLISIITSLGFASSNGEARRLIQQGGVSLDDEKITDVQATVSIESGQEVVLKAGKRKFAILKA